MSDFTAERFQDFTPGSEAIRVLLFTDCQTAELRQISKYDRVIRVIDKVKTGIEVLERATTLLPDVIIMSSDSPTPTAEFNHAIRGMCMAELADRVIVMVDNPAGYFRLAVKSGAAVLLHKSATYGELMSTLREVRESCKDPLASLLEQPSLKSRPQRPN